MKVHICGKTKNFQKSPSSKSGKFELLARAMKGSLLVPAADPLVL